MARLISSIAGNVNDMSTMMETELQRDDQGNKVTKDENSKIAKLEEDLDMMMDNLSCLKKEHIKIREKYDNMRDKYQKLSREYQTLIAEREGNKPHQRETVGPGMIDAIVRGVLKEMAITPQQGRGKTNMSTRSVPQLGANECVNDEANLNEHRRINAHTAQITAMKKGTNKKVTPKKQGSTPKNQKAKPRGAAIVIHCREGAASYANVIKKIDGNQGTKPETFGITFSGTRVTRTGGLLFEIPGGKEGRRRADEFVKAAGEIMPERARISCPRTKADIIISRMDPSIQEGDIAEIIAAKYKCELGEVTVRPIKIRPNQLGSAWVSVPQEVAEMACRSGKIQMRWSAAKVARARDRPVQCYKCLQYGHLKDECRSEHDRSGTCYKCGEMGHHAAGCNNKPRCLLCSEGQNTHRMGGQACMAIKEANMGREMHRNRRNVKRKKGKRKDGERGDGPHDNPEETDSPDTDKDATEESNNATEEALAATQNGG